MSEVESEGVHVTDAAVSHDLHLTDIGPAMDRYGFRCISKMEVPSRRGYPMQFSQTPSLTTEESCLEWSQFSSADQHGIMQRRGRACDGKECIKHDATCQTVNSKSAHCQGHKEKVGEQGEFPEEKQSKRAWSIQFFCKDNSQM